MTNAITSTNLLKSMGWFGISLTMKEILVVDAMRILKVDRKTLYRWAENKVITKMKRSGPMNIRIFDYDEIMRLAKKLPKKRGRSVQIIPHGPKT